MRIKIIDLHEYDTNARSIENFLHASLLKIRKRAIARDLIGDDERSKEFDASDFDVFADALSDGLELTAYDEHRISVRADRLAKCRAAASGTSHLKKDEMERLRPALGGVELVMARDEHWADEVAAAIHEDMPWMAPATEHAWYQLRRAARRGEAAQVGPMLLNGAPGIGKTVWARSLAKHLRVPMVDVDASKGGSGSALVGVERGWSSTLPGLPLDAILSRRIANPVVVIDEIFKAHAAVSNKGSVHAFADALLSLLETGTAKAWDCPHFRLKFDMSHISWVLTSNTLWKVPEPVRSRCQLIEIPDITDEQLIEFARRQCANAGIGEDAMEAVLEAIQQAPRLSGRRISLRDFVRMVERAEVLEGRPRVQ